LVFLIFFTDLASTVFLLFLKLVQLSFGKSDLFVEITAVNLSLFVFFILLFLHSSDPVILLLLKFCKPLFFRLSKSESL
jgi:hypothetical protein